MADIRALRLSRGLTLIDLAQLTGIPARRLAELEHGLLPLDQASRSLLAHVYGMPPEQLRSSAHRTQTRSHAGAWLQRGAFGLIAAMIVILILAGVLLFQQRPASAAAQGRAAPSPTTLPAPTLAQPRLAALRNIRQASSATAQAKPTQLATPPPSAVPPTLAPRFALAADGPHGCPLGAASGQVVITQGYSEGSHTPTNIWGAIDLGIDGDGDGYAEPGTTQGAPVAAALGGVAHVYLNSWPGGNFVRVDDAQSGWSVAYAHLDSVAVADGQAIDAGALIGYVGSTGMASGPHLHYEVWHGDANIDPTRLIECR